MCPSQIRFCYFAFNILNFFVDNNKKQTAHIESTKIGQQCPQLNELFGTHSLSRYASDGLMSLFSGRKFKTFCPHQKCIWHDLFWIIPPQTLMGKCVGIPWICETGHQIQARLIQYFAEVGARVMIILLRKMVMIAKMTKMTKMVTNRHWQWWGSEGRGC